MPSRFFPPGEKNYLILGTFSPGGKNQRGGKVNGSGSFLPGGKLTSLVRVRGGGKIS